MPPKSRPGTEVNMSVRIGSLMLKNPVMTASGTFASGREYSDFVDLGRLGAIVTKSVSVNPWPGNASPRIAETASGMLNSIGLQNPGVEVFLANDLVWLAQNAPETPVVVNVSGHSAEEYRAVIKRLEDVDNVAAYELNVSCPNVDAGGMAFGTDCMAAGSVVEACRAATGRPLIVKLSPNVTDIVSIAQTVEAKGADAVSLINTLLGMAIDVNSRRPKLARGVGGLSGPAIKPVAVRMVWQVASSVAIPVIGMGGVMSAEDVVEFMMAGATAVAVGTANFADPTVTMRIVDGLTEWCRSHGIADVSSLIGCVEV
jgi:dihydroorotate dehydrogenase (NAD+) catalytic subunit